MWVLPHFGKESFGQYKLRIWGWVIGNGKKIRFLEDHWLGNTSLAIIFWPLYVINEQQGRTICEICDG